ncbi:hypothetical protein KUV47_02250 [Vannielia litorea]|uniref:hypothetical protein n=1 Tax=Vannielia litorea TaxID=1217970 RepID=UPI001C94691D|nr:hypothetical protein [Vannielia litorea]MBY6152021.1 hypothetical protein [Vannielia litorea]
MDWRSLLGLTLTGLYSVFVLSLTIPNWNEFSSLEPNEWGDFLAGTAGPLALAWLVLSFYQQGEELRNSVRELEDSKNQQKKLADRNKEILELEARRQKEVTLSRAYELFSDLQAALRFLPDRIDHVKKKVTYKCAAQGNYQSSYRISTERELDSFAASAEGLGKDLREYSSMIGEEKSTLELIKTNAALYDLKNRTEYLFRKLDIIEEVSEGVGTTSDVTTPSDFSGE